jgi:hypothetical protein
MPDAAKASGNDAMPVSDIETAYRLYAEEISEAWKHRDEHCVRKMNSHRAHFGAGVSRT